MKLKDRIMRTFLLITTCITFNLFVNVAGAEVQINMIIDNEKVIFAEELGIPFADENNRTQVPLRLAMEKIGAEVEWLQDDSKAVIKKDDKVVEVIIDKSFIIIDGIESQIDTTPVVKNERIYLPIRFIVEAFDGNVEWKQEDFTVIINSKQNVEDNDENIIIDNDSDEILVAEDNKEIVEEQNENNKDENTNATIKGTYINVRTHMNVSSEVVYQLNDGDRVLVTKKDRKWYEIKDEDKLYYIYADYVVIDEGIDIEVEEVIAGDMPTVDKLYSEWALKYLYSKTLGTDAYNDLIYDVSTRKGLNPIFIKCIMVLESGGDIKTASSVNSKGVYYVGLMQVASNYGFDNERMLNDAEYAIECGIEIVNRKIQAARNKGNEPTVHEIAWRYNSYNEAGKPYAEKLSKLYEELTGGSRLELVTID